MRDKLRACLSKIKLFAIGVWDNKPNRWYRDLWLLVITLLVFFALNGEEKQDESIERQNDSLAQQNQKLKKQNVRLRKSIQANCVVLGVLLETRADRDTTVKLFAPIRDQNPEQFDMLVRRAKSGDKKLLAVAPDLSCKVSPRVLKALENGD